MASLLQSMQPESKDSSGETRKGWISGASKFKAALKKFKISFCLSKQSIFKILLEFLGCVLNEEACPSFLPGKSLSHMSKSKYPLKRGVLGLHGAAEPTQGESR